MIPNITMTKNCDPNIDVLVLKLCKFFSLIYIFRLYRKEGALKIQWVQFPIIKNNGNSAFFTIQHRKLVLCFSYKIT